MNQHTGNREYRMGSLYYLLAAAAIVALFLLALNNIMTYLNHNEHMYIAAAVFVKDNYALYRDFAFLQMPLLPLLYGYTYTLLGTDHYLLIGKLFSCLFYILSGSVVFFLARRLLRGFFLSSGVLVLYVLNTTVLQAAQESSNYILPIAASFIAFYLYVSSLNPHAIKRVGILLAGILVAVAIGTKAYYGVIMFPFIMTSLLFPRAYSMQKRVTLVLIPLVCGILIGLLPVLCCFARAPGPFLFNNLGYHGLNAQWRAMNDTSMTLVSKVGYARQVLFSYENVVPVLGPVLCFFFAFFSGAVDTPGKFLNSISAELCLSLSLFVVAVPAILIPTPTWLQYFAMPVSFSFLLLISSFAWSQPFSKYLTRAAFSSFVLLAFVCGTPYLLLKTVGKPWVGMDVHSVAQRIRSEIAAEPVESMKMATLSSLYAVEANIPIYHELATGPFLYRVGDLLGSEERSRMHGTSPQTIEELLEQDPPAAVFVGFHGDLDAPLRRYAESSNYRKVSGQFHGGQLYVRIARPKGRR
ncbi:MAG TPA: hypothetical protein VMZ31_16355 [Phycisphaerae bacterium]|nr:hypothetical protein [Phycisphaerae bacterium]